MKVGFLLFTIHILLFANVAMVDSTTPTTLIVLLEDVTSRLCVDCFGVIILIKQPIIKFFSSKFVSVFISSVTSCPCSTVLVTEDWLKESQ